MSTPSASGVAQDNVVDETGEPWVVVWHPQEEKALRTNISGSHPPQFSEKVFEPTTEPEDDDFMIAKWADVTESLIPNWTVRDARAKAEVDKQVKAKKDTYPTYYVAELPGNKIEVKKKVLSQNREEQVIICILENGKQKSQPLLSDDSFSEEQAADVMVSAAKELVDGEHRNGAVEVKEGRPRQGGWKKAKASAQAAARDAAVKAEPAAKRAKVKPEPKEEARPAKKAKT